MFDIWLDVDWLWESRLGKQLQTIAYSFSDWSLHIITQISRWTKSIVIFFVMHTHSIPRPYEEELTSLRSMTWHDTSSYYFINEDGRVQLFCQIKDERNEMWIGCRKWELFGGYSWYYKGGYFTLIMYIILKNYFKGENSRTIGIILVIGVITCE